MRKFVKTVAVLALAVSVLSTSAFAALTGDVTVTDGTYSLTVNGAVSGEQVTLLATDAANLASVTDANIWYIDQNATGEFSNFQLKDGSLAGKELFFYAASTSEAATLIDSVENLIVTVAAQDGVTEIEVGGTVALGLSFEGGRSDSATWTATKAGVDASSTLSNTSVAGATFTGSEAGTYVVKATVNGVDSNEVTITVNEPDTSVKATVAKEVTTVPGIDGAEAQSGYGVSLEITNWSADFTDMIWVFVTADDRYYSDPVAIAELEGIGEGSAVTINAAFANGSNNEAGLTIDDVEAIFTDGENEFFTDPANDDVADRRE